MRRFFGSKVINAAENSSSSSTPPGYQQPRGPVSRSTLCKPQKTWPPGGSRDGLTMRPLTTEEIKLTTGGNSKENQANNWMLMPGDKWFTIEHSPAYRWDQLRFIQAVGMFDPNNLFSLMRESYWHADTLLQIAEVYRAQDGERLIVVGSKITVVFIPSSLQIMPFHQTLPREHFSHMKRALVEHSI
jgi:hypothetical protein